MLKNCGTQDDMLAFCSEGGDGTGEARQQKLPCFLLTYLYNAAYSDCIIQVPGIPWRMIWNS